jgi:hypothetical protein
MTAQELANERCVKLNYDDPRLQPLRKLMDPRNEHPPPTNPPPEFRTPDPSSSGTSTAVLTPFLVHARTAPVGAPHDTVRAVLNTE